MISIYCLALSILKLVEVISALVELPQVEENNILKTDYLIRETTNKLFSIIKLKTNKHPALKQYSLIHNYLASTSLQHYSNLIEVAKITRVDKSKISNQTKSFMAILYEILNEDIKYDENEDEYVLNHKDGLEKNLNGYDIRHNYDKSNIDIIIADILDYIEENKTLHENYFNITSYNETQRLELVYENGTVTKNTNEFWVPNARRIYQGKKVSIKDFPFMASIHMFNHFQCAGSIIKADLIITAASCLQLAWNNRFNKENPSFLSARVGSTYYNVDGENIPILKVYFHPQYDPKTLRHNLCLLRLHRILDLKKRSRLKRIEIDRQAHPLLLNTKGITIVGWGARQRSNTITDPFLSFAVLDFYPTQECQDVYSRSYVTRNNFCGGFISQGSGACNRDIGGPGIIHGVLFGVVSFSNPMCGTPNAPTVFTKIGYYTDWIENVMEQDVIIGKQRTTKLVPPYLINEPNAPVDIKSNVTIFKVTPVSLVKKSTISIISKEEKDELPVPPVKKSTTSVINEEVKDELLSRFIRSKKINDLLRKIKHNIEVIERLQSTYSPMTTLKSPELINTDLGFIKPDDIYKDHKIQSNVESHETIDYSSFGIKKSAKIKSNEVFIDLTRSINDKNPYETVINKNQENITTDKSIINLIDVVEETNNKNSSNPIPPFSGYNNEVVTLITYSEKYNYEGGLDIDVTSFQNDTISQNKTLEDKFDFIRELANIISEVLQEELAYNNSITKHNSK